MEKQAALELIDFINESPTNFHAILNIKKELIAHGFTQLFSGESWQIERGKNISLRKIILLCMLLSREQATLPKTVSN